MQCATPPHPQIACTQVETYSNVLFELQRVVNPASPYVEQQAKGKTSALTSQEDFPQRSGGGGAGQEEGEGRSGSPLLCLPPLPSAIAAPRPPVSRQTQANSGAGGRPQTESEAGVWPRLESETAGAAEGTRRVRCTTEGLLRQRTSFTPRASVVSLVSPHVHDPRPSCSPRYQGRQILILFLVR